MSRKQSTQLRCVDLIRRVIMKQLSKGQPSLERAADALGWSARTLQRHLAEGGTSFSHLLDEVRLLNARELIRRQEKISDVAARLGYADAGSFTRAFERWTGMSPRQYRKSVSSSSKPAKGSPKNMIT